MRLTTLFLSLLTTLTPTTLAARLLVYNDCPTPIWLQSVGTSSRGIQKVAAGGLWSEQQYRPSNTGVSIQVVAQPNGFKNGAPILTLGYTANQPTNVYYSLDTDKGFGFEGEKIVVHGWSDDVPIIFWNGSPTTKETKVYWGETDLIMNVCAA